VADGIAVSAPNDAPVKLAAAATPTPPMIASRRDRVKLRDGLELVIVIAALLEATLNLILRVS
jgi:hypothetical protein